MKISAEMISTLAHEGAGSKASTPEDAFRQFETLLLSEVLKGGQKPFGGSHPLDGGSAGRLYREQFSDAIAEKLSEAGGVGIARSLLEQQRHQATGISKNVGATDE